MIELNFDCVYFCMMTVALDIVPAYHATAAGAVPVAVHRAFSKLVNQSLLYKESSGHCVKLLLQNMTGTEMASSASIKHSNPARPIPGLAVLQGRRVANDCPGLCIRAACVRFC